MKTKETVKTSSLLNKERSGVVNIRNQNHLAFIRHYLQCRNQAMAYRKVYKCSAATARANGNKLYNRPEIKAAILQKTAALEQRARDMAESEITAALAEQYLSIHEKRMLLTAMMRGRHKVNRYFKMKDEVKILEDNLPPHTLLRAIDMDTRLENGWYDRKPLPQTPAEKLLQKEQEKKRKEEEERKNAERQKNLVVVFGRKSCNSQYPDLAPEEEKALWQLSLQYESIDAKAMPLPGKFADCGCTMERNMDTGMYYMACPDEPEANAVTARENSVLVSPQSLQPLDDEELARIAKNSPLISAALRNELTIVLRPGGNRGHAATTTPVIELPPPVCTADAGTQAEEIATDDNHPLQAQGAAGLAPGTGDYRPAKEISEEYWQAWVNNATQKNHASYREVFALCKAGSLPPEKRKVIELTSAWEFHPQNPQLIRKKIA